MKKKHWTGSKEDNDPGYQISINLKTVIPAVFSFYLADL